MGSLRRARISHRLSRSSWSAARADAERRSSFACARCTAWGGFRKSCSTRTVRQYASVPQWLLRLPTSLSSRQPCQEARCELTGPSTAKTVTGGCNPNWRTEKSEKAERKRKRVIIMLNNIITLTIRFVRMSAFKLWKNQDHRRFYNILTVGILITILKKCPALLYIQWNG